MPGSTAITSLTASTLTSVDTLNDYLGQTSTSDAKTNAVAAAIAFVRDYCDRIFDSTRYRRWVYLPSGKTLALLDRPIIALNRCAYGAANYLSVALANTSTTSATLAVHRDRLRICTYDPTNGILAEDATYVTYSKVSSFVTGIAAATTLNTWTVSTLVDADSYCLKPMPPQDVLNTTIYLEGPDDEASVSGMDTDAGLVYLSGKQSGWFYLDYTAGYADIPDSLVQLTTEIAATILKSSAITGGLQSERIADYQYTVAQGGILTAFEPRLAMYRRRAL